MTLPDPFAFMLVGARLSGLAIASPVIGHPLVPARVRAGLVGVLALALAPLVPRAAPAEAPGPLALVGLMAVEALVGALIGLTAQLVLAGVQLGGQVAGIQMGLGIASIADPSAPTDATVIAHGLYMVALLAFLALDGHHVLLRAVLDSFRVAPVGAVALGGDLLRDVVAQASNLFVVGVRIMAPVLIVLVLVNAGLGVLARTVPHVNAFAVGVPVNVGVGLIVVGAALPFTMRFLATQLDALTRDLAELLRGLEMLAHG